MNRLDQILDKTLLQMRSPRIVRFRYMPYKMEIAKSAVVRLWRLHTPKFAIDADNEFAYENLIKWIHGDNSMKAIDPQTRKIINGDLTKGIYLAGNTGTGKSVALEIMAAYTNFDDVSLKVDGSIRKLQWPCYHVSDIIRDYQTNGDLSLYKKRFILCIQDLGQEPSEVLYMGTRINVLQEILSYRGDLNNVFTLITSNFPMACKPLQQIYGDRVVSRLWQMCNYLEMRGGDRRK